MSGSNVGIELISNHLFCSSDNLTCRSISSYLTKQPAKALRVVVDHVHDTVVVWPRNTFDIAVITPQLTSNGMGFQLSASPCDSTADLGQFSLHVKTLMVDVQFFVAE